MFAKDYKKVMGSKSDKYQLKAFWWYISCGVPDLKVCQFSNRGRRKNIEIKMDHIFFSDKLLDGEE